MTVLSLQYTLLKTVRRSRTVLMSGLPSVATDDTAFTEASFDTDEEHTFTAKNCLAMELGNTLDVELTFRNSDNTISATVRKDMKGMIFLPLRVTAVVRNPARLGYTLPIPVRAVTG